MSDLLSELNNPEDKLCAHFLESTFESAFAFTYMDKMIRMNVRKLFTTPN